MDPADQPRPSDLLIQESQGDLHILESDAGGDGVFNPDGTVNMVLIRPCNGRGLFNNIYESTMLEREAGKFKGWPMFDNHESPIARRARAPFPRPVSELAGVVRESWWDPRVTSPEDEKYGLEQGGVVGKCALTDVMESLVRKVPEAIKGSLNAQATSKRKGQNTRGPGNIVEGFVADPENSSFDLVTKAGAGGRVRSVLEALYDDSNATDGLTSALESVSDEDLAVFLRDHRPAVLEGGPEAMNLQEALQSNEVKGFIGSLIQEGVQTGIAAALPAALQARENDIRETVQAEFAEATRLRTLSGDAKTIIEAAPLGAAAKANLLEDYGLVERDDESIEAGRSLRLVEAVIDSDGKVTKSARAVLKDQLEEDIKRVRKVISESAPTIPRAPGGGSAGVATASTFGGPGSQWAEGLRKRGLDPSQFGAPKPEPTTATT